MTSVRATRAAVGLAALVAASCGDGKTNAPSNEAARGNANATAAANANVAPPAADTKRPSEVQGDELAHAHSEVWGSRQVHGDSGVRARNGITAAQRYDGALGCTGSAPIIPRSGRYRRIPPTISQLTEQRAGKAPDDPRSAPWRRLLRF